MADFLDFQDFQYDQSHLDVLGKDIADIRPTERTEAAETEEAELPELLSRDGRVVTELSIRKFDEICDEGFELLLSHYSYIEAIYMHGDGILYDYHLKIISEKLPKLRRLDIVMNTSITDIGLCYLSGGNILDEEDCEEEVHNCCPLLEKLYLWKASRITHLGLRAISSKLHYMQELDLKVKEVEREMFHSLARMNSLKGVVFRAENRISLRGSTVLEQAGFAKESVGTNYIASWVRD